MSPANLFLGIIAGLVLLLFVVWLFRTQISVVPEEEPTPTPVVDVDVTPVATPTLTPTPRPTMTPTPTPIVIQEELGIITMPTTGVGSSEVVTIRKDGFFPDRITIKKGQGITWENTDSQNHQIGSSITSQDSEYQPFNAVGIIIPGDKKTLQFAEPGIFNYVDPLYPQYTGTVIVE